MSSLLIENYFREIEKYIQYGGDKKETSIRRAFANLLSAYSKPHDLLLVDELEYITKKNGLVYPDGTIKDALRLTHGYWEAKDENDDLEIEIEKKFKKGYPSDNILFEDSRTAVLIQNDVEVLRADMRNPIELDCLIHKFIEFERPELKIFRAAIIQFKSDLPDVLIALRSLIDTELQRNEKFVLRLSEFLSLCKEAINPMVEMADAQEMLIQHILTEDIFYTIFNDTQFHRENNIARELQEVAETFFSGEVKHNYLKRLASYYGAIRHSASGIANHHEKQKFLKAIYENFYKIYNPHLAERLGVVYTPNEIVRFMIESADVLLYQNYGKLLSSKGVEILDPATGTGTFVTDLIEHFKNNKENLKYKYKNELHCNEVAILPYYIANLNIEFTYAQIMGEYAEFPNICFVDTLDNLGFETTYSNFQKGMDFGFTAENTERVKNQNAKKISVIIGNPPYFANQKSENDDNKSRAYPFIDDRIKKTYIAESTAQKTKAYDMYVRFFRWASDRLQNNGMLAFITNRSFIDKRGFDGFRKIVQREFNRIYIIDLGGDLIDGKDGTKENVFGIKTGVAISFFIKSEKQDACQIFYCSDFEKGAPDEKLDRLNSVKFGELNFQLIEPDADANWLDITDNDFDTLVPLANKKTKAAKGSAAETALFKSFSLGISTNRDQWITDISEANLAKKFKYFIAQYQIQKDKDNFGKIIKWSRNLKRRWNNGARETFDKTKIRKVLYRPFYITNVYDSALFVDERGGADISFRDHESLAIVFSWGKRGDFSALCTNVLPCLDLYLPSGAQYLPMYLYGNDSRVENGTDFGLAKFQEYYGPQEKAITKSSIFYYVYAVLHDPIYREKYSTNLKRKFPGIPFYENFSKWVSWGGSFG